MTAVDVSEVVESHLHIAEHYAYFFARRHPRLHDDFFSDASYQLWWVARKYAGAIPAENFDRLVRHVCRLACISRIRKEYAKNRAAFCEQAEQDALQNHPADDPDAAALVDARDELTAILAAAGLSQWQSYAVWSIVGFRIPHADVLKARAGLSRNAKATSPNAAAATAGEAIRKLRRAAENRK